MMLYTAGSTHTINPWSGGLYSAGAPAPTTTPTYQVYDGMPFGQTATYAIDEGPLADRTGTGNPAFTGSQYIVNDGPVAPPFAIPTMVDGKATGFTQPSAEAFQEAIGWQQPTSSGEALALWSEYIQNAYHGKLPARLREVDAAIRSGEGLSDHMVNRLMYDDAMWGGAVQDVPSGYLSTVGVQPTMVGTANVTYPSLEQRINDPDIYQTPIATDPATLYGPLSTIGDSLELAAARGVPTMAIQQAADFDAGLQAARYEQGDLPTNTGPGKFFQLAALVPGLQPIAGIAEAIKNRDFATGLLALSSPIHGDLINRGKTLAGDAVSNLGFHKLGASIAPEISDLNAIIAQTPFGQTPEFAARVGLSPSPVAQSVRLARGNAVPGARTGINSALPEMGGGLTTAQGAGRAALNKIPRTGLTGAVLAANSPAALTTASMPFLDRATDTLGKVLNSQAAQNLSAAEMNAPATVFLQPPAITRGATAQSQYASPTTGLREALARNLAQRLAGNRLTALSPVNYGLLRV